jgi:hypothetical protein
MVNMPDRPVPFQEVMTQSQAPVYTSMHQSANLVSATRSSMVMTGKSKSALLSGKVNGLLAATKEEEQTDEDIDLMNELADSVNNKKKGLLGGLFGKKEK